MSVIRDLSGQKFGRLTALYPTEKRDKKGSVYWHCKCECGNEIDVSLSGLVYGNYKSCGCLKRECGKNIHDQLHLLNGTCVEWLQHRKSRCDSTSGFRGVYKTKAGKYRVTIGFKGERYQLGTYREFQDAVDARLEAEHLIHDGFLEAYEKWCKRQKEDPKWAEENPLIFNVHRENKILTVETNMK